MNPKTQTVIERRLLDLAYTTNLEITAPALAYFAPCSIDEADAVLSDMTARNRLQMDISDEGVVSYKLLGRPKLDTAKPLTAPVMTRALVRQPEASPLAAAALSVMLPGAGHLYTGRAVAAVLWFLVVSLGYVLIVPGLILHMFNIASAATSARRLNAAVG